MSLNSDHRSLIRDHFKRLLGNECEYCGTNFNLTFHHIVPCNQGEGRGSDNRAWDLFTAYDKENLSLLCDDCHKRLHRKELMKPE